MCRPLCLIATLLLAVTNARATNPASSEIPFEYREGLIWIKASVAHSTKPLNLLLDTGAAASVINLPVAQQLGLKPGKPISVRGVESTLTGYWLKGVHATAQGISLPAEYIALDLTKLSNSCERPVDGLLGADFFRGCTVQINFEDQTIRFLPADTRLSVNSLPLQVRPCGMRVPITVNGHKSQWVRLDTGCATSLQWVTSTVRPEHCSRRVAIGLTKISIPQVETTVHLGSFHFDSVPTGLHKSALFEGEAGLLGAGLLSRFARVTIDARRGLLFLELGAE